MVKRLNFTIPEFTRLVWASDEAKAVWEPRIRRVGNVWQDVERTAVRVGLKPATLQVCDPKELIDLAKWCADADLSMVPLAQQGASRFYSNATTPFDPARPWAYRVVIGPNKIVKDFVYFWKNGNDNAIGDALGFPYCCQDFFDRYWVKGGWRDLTLPMVLGHDETNHYKVAGPEGCNILLRWLGIRLVSHLPCSFTCGASETLSVSIYNILKSHYPQEAEWISEMLNWPVRWSSLHGVAIITTPVVRVVTSTDALADRVVIDREGSAYPKEGMAGTEFPFRQTYPVRLVRRPLDVWTDNGFRSMDAMNHAHRIILDLVGRLPFDVTPKIIDLGCGNGLLLEKIGEIAPRADLYGIEVDSGRWERACRRMTGSRAVIMKGDLHDDIYWEPPYGLTLLSMNRLDEVDAHGRDELLERIARGSEYLLLYCYDGRELLNGWNQYFEPYVSAEEDATVRAHLLRSLNGKEARDSSGPRQENKGRAGGDGSGRYANASDRRRENRGRAARAVDNRSSGEARREDCHES